MSKIVLTYDDFVALPDDGKRYELHEGELSVTPSPGRRHQTVLGRLYRILVAHVEASGQGEVFLSPFDVILSNSVEGGPTLAVEIISPYTGYIDRRRKLGLYARHDVTWYWIVDPKPRTIEVYHLEAGAYARVATLEGTRPRALPPFPDLSLDPAAIWR